MAENKISLNAWSAILGMSLGLFISTFVSFPRHAYEAWAFSNGALSNALFAFLWVLPLLLCLVAFVCLAFFSPDELWIRPKKVASIRLRKTYFFSFIALSCVVLLLVSRTYLSRVSGLATLDSIAMKEFREYGQSQARLDAGFPSLEILKDTDFWCTITSDSIRAHSKSDFEIFLKKEDGKFVCKYEYIRISENNPKIVFNYVSEDFLNTDAYRKMYLIFPEALSGYNIFVDGKRVPNETAKEFLSKPIK